MEHIAFVAGATGLTGRAVVQKLRERGIEAVAHVRPDSSRIDEWRTRFEAMGATVDATPWDEDAFVATLRERVPTIVFALLGTTKRRARQAKARGNDPAAESYERVDYGLTALLRRAAEASGHTPRFVYLSAIGASATTGNAYMRVRGRIEAELREGDLPYTVVQPSFIVGARDEHRSGEAIGAAVMNGALGFVGALGGGKLRDRYRSVTGDELAEMLVRVAVDPNRRRASAPTSRSPPTSMRAAF